MTQFDFNRARNGAEVVTRSGCKVTITEFEWACPGRSGADSLMMGSVEGGTYNLWDRMGHYNTDASPDPLDLFLA